MEFSSLFSRVSFPSFWLNKKFQILPLKGKLSFNCSSNHSLYKSPQHFNLPPHEVTSPPNSPHSIAANTNFFMTYSADVCLSLAFSIFYELFFSFCSHFAKGQESFFSIVRRISKLKPSIIDYAIIPVQHSNDNISVHRSHVFFFRFDHYEAFYLQFAVMTFIPFQSPGLHSNGIKRSTAFVSLICENIQSI